MNTETSRPGRARQSHAALGALAGILILALALRLGGIGFGLPYIYHYDEHFYINTALQLGAGVLHNPPYVTTGLPNLLFGLYAGYYELGHLANRFNTPADFEAAYRSDPTIFHLMARLTTAVFGTLTAGAVYILGRAAHGSRSPEQRLGRAGSLKTGCGLLAALFLAVSFLHVRDSHYAVPDIAMTLFVTLAVALATMAARYHRWQYASLAGLAGGLAVAMKWTALLVVIPVLLGSVLGRGGSARAFHETARARLSRTGGLLGRACLVALLPMAAGWALASWQVALKPAPYLAQLLAESQSDAGGGRDQWQIDSLAPWLFYGRTLWYGLGPVAMGLGLVGAVRRLVLTVRKRDAMSALLLILPIGYYWLLSANGNDFARYILPVLPFLAFFAAEATLSLWTWAGTYRARMAGAAVALLAALAIAQPLACSIRHDILLTRVDTRTAAHDWIEAYLPAGAKIAVDWQVHGPPLSTIAQPVPGSHTTFDLLVVGGSGLADHSVDWYRSQGFDFLIASSFIYDIHLLDRQADTARQAFYAGLDRDLQLVREFRPSDGPENPPFIFDEIYGPAVSLWSRSRPGPTIKIYAVAGG